MQPRWRVLRRPANRQQPPGVHGTMTRMSRSTPADRNDFLPPRRTRASGKGGLMAGAYSLCFLVDRWRPLIIARGSSLFGRFRPAAGALLAGALLAVASLSAAQVSDSQKCRELFLAENYVNAHELCRDLATAGDFEAQVVMGYLLAFGDGVERDTATAAHVWHRAFVGREDQPPAAMQGLRKRYARQLGELVKAASGGEADAQFLLGTMVDHGVIFPRKRDAAAEWYGRAAELGHVRAQVALAVLHDRRYIANADPDLAAQWYRRAALAQAYGDAAHQLTRASPLPQPKPTGPAPQPTAEPPERTPTLTARPRPTENLDEDPRPAEEAQGEPAAGPSPEDQLRAALDTNATEGATAPPAPGEREIAAEPEAATQVATEAPQVAGAEQSDGPLPGGLTKGDDETLDQYQERLGSMSNEELLKLLGIR